MSKIFSTMKVFAAAAILAVGGLISGCSDSTSTSGGTIQMSSELDQGGVGSIAVQKGAEVSAAGATVDSLYITRVRLLVSNMKMHSTGNDTTKGGTIKTGPFLIQFDSSGQRVFTSATVPAGTYDRIKFEIHKFSSSEANQYLNDPVFSDFAADERYTSIIEGYVVAGGQMMPFTFRSRVTENIQVRFDENIVLEDGSTEQVTLQFQPRAAFKKGSNKPLDPRDGDNRSEIEKMIKDALKALKK
jgi:hypothetical protein